MMDRAFAPRFLWYGRCYTSLNAG